MKIVQKILIGCTVLCLIIGIAYFVAAWYYSKGFSVNTWINGVYCTGKTIEEVNLELLEYTKAPSVIIVDKEGRRYSLMPENIGLKPDYMNALEQYLADQNPLLWVTRVGKELVTVLQPSFSYEEEKLEAFWNDLDFVKEERSKAPQVFIELSDEKYQLVDTTKARLNEKKAYELFRAFLNKNLQEYDVQVMGKDSIVENVLELKDSGVYEDIQLSAKQEDILSQWEKVSTFQNTEIIYDMGDEQIKVDASVIIHFLERKKDNSFRINNDGTLYISREKVDAFIDAIADEYDTFQKERAFASTRGDLITIKKGSYGTLINRNEEKEYLYSSLTKQVSEVHVPVYERKAYHRGKNDIGSSYIEIDMTNQKMYLYQNGKCLVDTDIVTGCTGKRMGTPEGIYSVYSMQKNRILRGPGYASSVKYWMPVNGNIGIHDAGWRDDFGGEIYKKNGSHGCINTPNEAMKHIYENVEIGIPVVMFY